MSSIRPLDLVLIAVFLVLTSASFFFVSRKDDGVRYVSIETSDDHYYLPLSEDEEITVHGPAGKTIIRVEDGTAGVTHSDCQDKICLSMGQISQQPGWIACLPNKVFLRIVSLGAQNELDIDAGVF